MTVFSSLRNFLELEVTPDLDARQAAQRSNRRRLKVFVVVFLAVSACGLSWDFLRPAEYRATARVQINPGSNEPRQLPTGRTDNAHSTHASSAFLTEVQALTSRPLLAKVGDSLFAAGYPVAGPADRGRELQEAISATAVSGTDVVELQAVGRPPELMAAALNALLDAYRDEVKATFETATGETLAQAREETAKLEQAVRERRAQLDAFRSLHGVWSSQREGNEAVERMKGLTTALAAANEKAAIAEARLSALRGAAAGGGGSGRAKDDPTLATMEQRASALREQIRDMERTYTPAFMAMDPNARALRARLAEIERQIDEQRVSSRRSTLTSAEEEYASARATVDRLQAQINEQRRGMQVFSERFNQAKSLEDDLAQVEKASREAIERQAKLEASERSRQPSLTVIEQASTPTSAFRPDYGRDALIVLVVAFCLGLLAIWFVELFNRPPPLRTDGHTMVVVPPSWTAPGLIEASATPAGRLPLPGNNAVLLSVPAVAARELSPTEVTALLAAADPDARFVIALLLMGLTVEELIGLATEDFDPANGYVEVKGGASRRLLVPEWLARGHPVVNNGGSLVRSTAGTPINAEDIASLLVCTALDARLSEATEVTADVLRHTCIAWLVRQGLRFSDFAAFVSRPDPATLASYARLAPEGVRVAKAEIDPLLPALRHFVA